MGGLTSCANNQGGQAAGQAVGGDSCGLAIAYVNVDSLLTNYDFAKDLNEALIKKTEDARANFNSQAASFERDYNEFQRKLQTNAFLNEDRAKSEANRLENKKNQLDQLNAKLQQELAQEQLDMNTRLNDTIHNFLFYPSQQGDREIQLYKNALIKLQGFHSAFGDDAHIFSREEIVKQFKLFDSTVKDSVDEKLALLREVRNLYAHNRAYYHKIKALPQKSRVMRRSREDAGKTIRKMGRR